MADGGHFEKGKIAISLRPMKFGTLTHIGPRQRINR